MLRFEHLAQLRSFSPTHRGCRDELRLDRSDVEGVLAHWMEREQRALVAVTEQLVIQWANPAAQELISGPSALRRQNGRLHARCAGLSAKLRTFVHKATSSPSTMCLVTDAPDENIVVFAMRLDPPWEYIVGLTLRSARQRFVVQLADPALALGLTRAEAQVAGSLLGGRTAEETAEVLRVSIETVRTHIKRSYAKLGVSSREAFFHKLAPYVVTVV